jgi:hypothetical protein
VTTPLTDPLGALLAAGLLPATAYPPTSRYAGVPVVTLETGDGPVRHLARRLVPPTESAGLIGFHSVVAGDRPDLIAHAAFGDALLWWRLADANGCLDPAELTDRIGRQLRLTLPPGTPGGVDG